MTSNPLHQTTRTVDDVLRDMLVIHSGRTRYPGQEPRDDELLVAEIEGLRALVKRLTNVAQDLASGLSDPGSEALAAIHCGRHFIYG